LLRGGGGGGGSRAGDGGGGGGGGGRGRQRHIGEFRRPANHGRVALYPALGVPPLAVVQFHVKRRVQHARKCRTPHRDGGATRRDSTEPLARVQGRLASVREQLALDRPAQRLVEHHAHLALDWRARGAGDTNDAVLQPLDGLARAVLAQ